MSTEIITSPLQGIVSSLCVAVGDKVSEGDVLCLLEAMKMLTPVESSVSGKVAEIHVEEKKSVARGEKLLAIEF
jgi:biotin carboxyl carrier protein